MSIHSFARKCAFPFLALSTSLLLAACGGGGGGGGGFGGGETLAVSVHYDDTARLFEPTVITPTITGLNGHSPHCTLASGTLPAGMALNDDCSITGAPLQFGSFPIMVHLGASGVSNQLDWSAGVLVLGPSLVFDLPSSMTPGTRYDIGLLNTIFWTPSPADVVTYSVAEGALPTGLTLDPGTGHIVGTPTTPGTYSFKIEAQVVNAGRTARAAQQFPEMVTVNTVDVYYNSQLATIGLPFSTSPLVAPDPSYRLSAPSLPPGLSIDPVTGVISGTPTALANGNYRIDLTRSTADGGTFTTSVTVPLRVRSPLYVAWYTPMTAMVGYPFGARPVIQNVSDAQSAPFSYSFAVDPASALPAGLTLDPAGEISGMFTTVGEVQFLVNATINFNGTTFVLPANITINARTWP